MKLLTLKKQRDREGIKRLKDRLRSEGVCQSCCRWPATGSARCRECAQRQNQRRRARGRSIRLAVFSHYGKSCACCGEKRDAFLVIDHVEGAGNAHRREVGTGWATYKWLVDNGFPPGFQTLCHNCNAAKAKGGCPHGNPAGQLVRSESSSQISTDPEQPNLWSARE